MQCRTDSFAESERNSGSSEMNIDGRDSQHSRLYSEGQRMASSFGGLIRRKRKATGPILGLQVSLRRIQFMGR
jgi:hypothetical protein